MTHFFMHSALDRDTWKLEGPTLEVFSGGIHYVTLSVIREPHGLMGLHN